MDELNNAILSELQKITKLLVANITKDISQQEQIAILSKIGFQPKEIATFIGTTANSVRVTLNKIRKK